MLSLVPNLPLDLAQLATLLIDKDDLFLVWPEAKFPFDQEQWREKLLSRPGNRSYFVALDSQIIGHAALIETDEPEVRALSYVFIRSNQRGRGFGRELIRLMEVEAKITLRANALRLRVRTYNPRALRTYEKSGFVRSQQDGTLVIMCKMMAP